MAFVGRTDVKDPGAQQDYKTPSTSWPPNQHMLRHQPEHDIRYYWDTHLCASFMVDPLGLK